MQTVSETFAGTITVHRQMRLALPRMAMSLLIMSYLVADGVLISRFVGTTALSALSMSYPAHSTADRRGLYDRCRRRGGSGSCFGRPKA